MKRAFILLVLSVLFLFGGCATTIKTTALVPARYHQAAILKEVAVLPFDGAGGREFTSEIEGTLGSINIGDKQYFTLIERTKLNKVMDELKFSQSGLVDESKAAQLGKMVGAKGIYTGVINKAVHVDKPFKEERQVCAQREIKRDRKGNLVEGACISWNRYHVNCIERIATFEFTPKLIEVETGRVVYSRTILKTVGARGCSDEPKPIPSPVELISRAKDMAKEDFRRDVAPHYVNFDIVLMDSKDGIVSKDAENKFEKATEYAKANRMDRACELWGEARILSPNAPSILYNLGICAEITGDIEKAYDLYQKADRELGKPDDNITKALNRTGEQLKKQRLLKEQLSEAQTKKEEMPETKQEVQTIKPEAQAQEEKPVKKETETTTKKKSKKTRRTTK